MRVCLLIAFVFSFFQLLAIEPVVWKDGTKEIDLSGSYLELFIDAHQLPIEQLDKTSTWFSLPEGGLQFARKKDALYWGRFKLDTRQAKTSDEVILEFTDHRIDEIHFYIKRGGGFVELESAGDQRAFNARRFFHKNFEYVLEPQSAKVNEYYFSVGSDHPVGLRCKLRSFDFFFEYSVTEYLLLGLFYGAIIIITVLNVFFFLRIRQWTYLLYAGYVLNLGLFSACCDGFAYQFIWPEGKNYSEAFAFFLYAAVIFESLYVIVFLRLKEFSPRLYYGVLAYIGFRTLWLMVGLLLNKQLLYEMEIDLIPFGLAIYAGFYVYIKHDYKPARFFLLGFAFVACGYVVYAFMNMGYFPVNIFNVYATQVGAVVEFSVLTLAFADRLRFERLKTEEAQKRAIDELEDKKRIQEEINIRLEDKVRDRTDQLNRKSEALEENNKKLQDLQHQLMAMNEQLDKQNWQLNKQVTIERKSRLEGDELSYEAFSKLFQNDNDVRKLLDELKQQRGLACTKCQNKKLSLDAKSHVYVCSKCAHKMSATSGTLLHGVRFSLVQALYIAHVVYLQKKISVKDLAESIELRTATVSNFKNKVLKSMDDLPPSSDWHSVLLLD